MGMNIYIYILACDCDGLGLNFYFYYCFRDEIDLKKSLLDCQNTVDNALKDDFNTPLALRNLMKLVKRSNRYYLLQVDDCNHYCLELVDEVNYYINHMFNIFGIDECLLLPTTKTYQSPRHMKDGSNSFNNNNELIQSLQTFRSSVRQHALGAIKGSECKDTALQNILKECDQLRSKILIDYNVQFKDFK